MKFDRTTVLGFVVMAVLLFGYFYFTNKEQATHAKQMAEQKRVEDSIKIATGPRTDSQLARRDSIYNDSIGTITREGGFKGAGTGTEQLTIVENDVFKIAFTNKGGQVKYVELKKFKNQDSGQVRLAGSAFDKLSYPINTGQNVTAQTADLYFQPGILTKNPDGSTTVSFQLTGDSNSAAGIVHQFLVRKDDYMIDFTAKFKDANNLLTQGNMNMVWQYTAAQQESSLSYEKENTQMGYVEDGEFDYNTIGRRSEVEFDKNLKWVGMRQRFFFGAIVAKDKFASGKMEWTVPEDTSIVVQATTTLKAQLPVASETQGEFSIYYGPSDYHILKKYDYKFEKLINLGQGMYAFVRPLNKYVIMPIFDFMKNFGSVGIAIALLTLFIRLLISPLTYSSYVSGAKMKALRPEIAKLKEKHGGDQQAMSMDQMKLFREAGVNPLGGCIPALLQIPIFFALFSFFSSEISLRGENFLWAKDLAAYDDVIKFGFHIPLLGDHLSLFTLTAVITSLLISVYSMSMSPDQSNPVMKYLPYIFPIFLLFIFNRLPSALTWYYTVSNLVTLALQFVIQNYIIDHNKILAKIEENRKKPKKKSKWQERMEQMQEQQKKMKEMQQKGKR